MKKLFKVMCVLFVCLFAGTALTACFDSGESDTLTYVSLRINPQIELVIDENGNVAAVNAINEDGEIVLTQLNLIGLSVEEASELFTEEAAELGYIDVDSENTTVYVHVDGENSEAAQKIRNGITDKINRFFDNKGIYGKVSAETLDQYAPQADEWNVSVGHAKMILRILDMYPEMTPSDILALSVSERVALIKGNKENGITAEFREEYRAMFAALKEKYGNMFALETEIEGLKESLDNEDLTEEERNAITENINLKEAEYALQLNAFKSEFDALKAEYKQKSEEAKEAREAVRNSKKAENQQKIREHNENFSRDKETVKSSIRQWRKNQNKK